MGPGQLSDLKATLKRPNTYLCTIGIVQVSPIDKSIQARSILLHCLSRCKEFLSCKYFKLWAFDGDIVKQHDHVFGLFVQSEHITAFSNTVLREASGNGLEHELRYEVRIGRNRFPFVYEFFVKLNELFVYFDIVFERQCEPYVATFLSVYSPIVGAKWNSLITHSLF